MSQIVSMVHMQFCLHMHSPLSWEWHTYTIEHYTVQRAWPSVTDRFQSPIIYVWLHIQNVSIYNGSLHNSPAPCLDMRLMKPAAWCTLGFLFLPRNKTAHKERLSFLPTYWLQGEEQDFSCIFNKYKTDCLFWVINAKAYDLSWQQSIQKHTGLMSPPLILWTDVFCHLCLF